jgi:ATP-dependent helicase HrpB
MSPPPPTVPQPLPIDEVLPELLAALANNPTALLRAPTGAGKTTRVPGAVLDALPGGQTVVMLEPRRMAARATARRIAWERGSRVGGEVGYRVRFDTQTSAATRLCVETEGLFLRRLQNDPFLEGIGAVIFDEFHERSLTCDLALALCCCVRRETRADLALVVMSATLESDGLQEYLGSAPLIESRGRLFDVEERYLPVAAAARRQTRVEDSVCPAVLRALEETAGLVLVFLPGVGEIRRVHSALEALRGLRGVQILELYGDLDPRDQDRVLADSARRRVVLATNIAETSLTIPGVSAVVDTGLARRVVYDRALGLDRLELAPISRASARQRAGRAGRTAPGICYRLWSAAEERGRSEEDSPEVRRVDISGAALELACFGERNLESFPWFEAPPPAALARARELLEGLGAIESGGQPSWRVTTTGRQLNGLPLAPRLGRLLLEGAAAGVAGEAALCAALLAERSPFRRGDSRSAPRVSPHDSDWLDAVYALEAFEQGGETRGPAGELQPAAARRVLRARDQLQRLVTSEASPGTIAQRDEATLKALFTAFPDRLACRRAAGSDRAQMVGGRGVRLAPECGVRESRLFVCVDLDAGGTESLVRRASRVEREWLEPERITCERRLSFDAKSERVLSQETTCYRSLVLESRSLPTKRDDETANLLLAAARANLPEALDLDLAEVHSWLARLACVGEWCPELELPDQAQLLSKALQQLSRGRTSFQELRRAPLLKALCTELGWERCTALEKQAPERLTVPSGSQIALAYEAGQPPVLCVRIQEMFGQEQTPRVGLGRVPVLLHLLAPNGRPQQVTSDLASFWTNTYAEVRRDLRRRYPRHSWPEDPRSAKALRGVPRRR